MDKQMLKDRIEQVMKDYRRDHPRLERELKKCLREAEKTGEIFLAGRASLYLSMCAYEMGDRSAVLSHAYKAVGIFENSDDYEMLARSYNLLGIAYGALENFQLSLDAYDKALETIRAHKDTGVQKEMVLNNIADCYYQMGEYQKSIRIVKGCLSSCKKKGSENNPSIVIYGLNLSDSYESLGELDRAKEVLDDMEDYVEKLEKSPLTYGYYARRSCLLYKFGDAEGGARFADLVLEGVLSKHDSYEFHRDFEKIASHEVACGDYERAQRFAEILTDYAVSNGRTLDLITSKRVQANICDSRGERKTALELYKELNDLYEKRMNEQNAMQYESQKNAEAASSEIAKLMRKVRDTEEKAERDPLTGLMNRSALVNITSDFIQKAKDRGRKLGGIFLDIDFFKEFNDTYGHAAGDEAIKLIASVCLEVETSTVRFFRYGGDEYFGIVLGHKDEYLESLALKISEKVRSSGVEHIKNPNGQRLTVSIGVVNVDMKESDNTILDIIKHADKALYHAKDYGKNVVFAYHASSESEHEYRRVYPKKESD